MTLESQTSERNERYFAQVGYGFGKVGANTKVLRTLTTDQIDAIVDMILNGDIYEIAEDEFLLGKEYANDAHMAYSSKDERVQEKFQIIAALVYLSNHLAEDIPSLNK